MSEQEHWPEGLSVDRTRVARPTSRLRELPPTKDNLLVLYFNDAVAVDAIVERLTGAGHPPVEPENPYWTTTADSVTVEDPDGWRVVLVKPRG